MATYVPPKRATTYIFYTVLFSGASAVNNPTIAAGDFTVQVDGVDFGNIDTLPTVDPAGSDWVKVTVSVAEMTGDNIGIIASDQTSPAAWDDQAWLIQTTARQIDDLTFPNTSGRGIDVDASGGVEVGSFQSDVITAAAIATDAITSDELAASATAEIAAAVWTYATRTLTSFGTLAADVWAYATRTLTSFGALAATIADAVWDEATSGHTTSGTFGEILGDVGAEVWTYATRTLTQSAASVTATVAGAAITITRGDTLSASLTGLGDLTGYTSIDWTVKEQKSDSDADAIIRIRVNASGTGDGLLRFNKAAVTDATLGSITIDDVTDGDITIALAASAADDLQTTQGLYYDVQKITGTTVQTLTENRCSVSEDVTRAIT
jgi:hypothetical protein